MPPRTKPRISVNKLAEYINATTTRRKKIVADAKDPDAFVITRYGDALKAIRSCLQQGDLGIIEEAIQAIGNKSQDTDFQKNDAKNSIELLEAFKEVDLSVLEGFSVEAPNDIENKKIEIQGVVVSIQPDIILSREVKGVRQVGGIKISHAKTKPLSEDSQQIVALMVRELLTQDAINSESSVLPKACFSFDVFKKRLVCCPPSSKARMKQVEAACEEIALWWTRV
jgi:hypothetical protein